jgi:hypothetical protein
MESYLLVVSVDVQELLEVSLQDLDFADDLVGCCGPREWLGVLVPVGNVVLDVSDELSNGLEGASADGSSRDDSEPGFYLERYSKPHERYSKPHVIEKKNSPRAAS